MRRPSGRRTKTVLLTLVALIAAACDRRGNDRAASGAVAAAPASGTVGRGEYLVNGLLQCFLCHSERDWERPGAPPAEGRAGAGAVAWSDGDRYRLVAPNLTPDDETGIGRWTDEQLARAIRRGIGRDGRVLSPRMWYNSFRHLTDRDVAAVIAYLRSREPVYHPLPPTVLPPDLQARLDAKPTAPLKPVDLSSPDPVEVGRGLVLLADCAGCHTAWEAPRTPGLLGGGNVIARGERSAFSTNISPHPSGMAYGADAFIEVMRTGKQGGLHPIMPWIVFRNLSDADLRAIHAFLQTVQPVGHYINNHASPTRCVTCDQEHGLGDMNRAEAVTGIELDPGTYDRYVGSFYSAEYDFTLQVSVDGDRLVVSDDGDPAVALVPQSPSRFVVPGWTERLRFVFDANGRAMQVIAEEVESIALDRVARD